MWAREVSSWHHTPILARVLHEGPSAELSPTLLIFPNTWMHLLRTAITLLHALHEELLAILTTLLFTLYTHSQQTALSQLAIAPPSLMVQQHCSLWQACSFFQHFFHFVHSQTTAPSQPATAPPSLMVQQRWCCAAGRWLRSKACPSWPSSARKQMQTNMPSFVTICLLFYSLNLHFVHTAKRRHRHSWQQHPPI